jgi:hypothetical protein
MIATGTSPASKAAADAYEHDWKGGSILLSRTTGLPREGAKLNCAAMQRAVEDGLDPVLIAGMIRDGVGESMTKIHTLALFVSCAGIGVCLSRLATACADDAALCDVKVVKVHAVEKCTWRLVALKRLLECSFSGSGITVIVTTDQEPFGVDDRENARRAIDWGARNAASGVFLFYINTPCCAVVCRTHTDKDKTWQGQRDLEGVNTFLAAMQTFSNVSMAGTYHGGFFECAAIGKARDGWDDPTDFPILDV